MDDRTARDASLGPLHTPQRSADKHGSEEGFLRSPTIEVESPQYGNRVPSTAPGDDLHPGDDRPPNRVDDTDTPPPADENNAAKLGDDTATKLTVPPPVARTMHKIDDPREWTTTDVVNWLFVLQVDKETITFVTQNEVTGLWLLELIEYPECHEILRDDFHITQAFKRITFVTRLRELVKAAAKTTSQVAKQGAEVQTMSICATLPTTKKTINKDSVLTSDRVFQDSNILDPLCDADQTAMELLDASRVSTLKSEQTDFTSDANYEPPQDSCVSAMPQSRSAVAKQIDNFASLSGRVSTNKVVQQDDCHFKWKWYLTDG